MADRFIAKGMDFEGKNHSIELVIEAKFDKICPKCCEFGHNSLKPCQKTTKCHICGQNHKGNEHKCSVKGYTAKIGTKCFYIPTKCVNYGGNHLTTSSYYLKRLELVKNRREEKKLQQKRPEIAVIIPFKSSQLLEDIEEDLQQSLQKSAENSVNSVVNAFTFST